MNRYEENRAKFPPAELQRYCGQWVAFSMDGSRILAGASTLTDLETRLAAAGVDPQDAALERIDLEDSVFGGAELT